MRVCRRGHRLRTCARRCPSPAGRKQRRLRPPPSCSPDGWERCAGVHSLLSRKTAAAWPTRHGQSARKPTPTRPSAEPTPRGLSVPRPPRPASHISWKEPTRAPVAASHRQRHGRTRPAGGAGPAGRGGGQRPHVVTGAGSPGFPAVLGVGFALGLVRLMLSPGQLPGKATHAAERHCPWRAEGAGGWRSSQLLLLPVAHKTLKVIHLPADNVENTGRQDPRTRPQHVRQPLLGSF